MRGLSCFLLSLFLLSCSQELPLSSDSPSAASKEANDAPERSIALHPAGKATDDDCTLCGIFDTFNDQEEEGGDETQEEETDSTSSEGGPDLIVRSPSASAVVLTPGQAFTLHVTVHNQGDQQAAATMLHYYRSNNSTITASDTEVSTDAVDSLDASATSAQSIELTASVGVERYYGACVASVSGEINTDNNCSSAVKITVSEQEATQEEDRAALVVLYEATGGDNWHSNSNWLSSAPLKDWYGVGVNSEGRVTKLWLHENGLRGRLPSALGNLEKLEELWLSSNQLSGSISPELGQLANLRKVYIRWNRFTGCLPQAWQTVEDSDFEYVGLSFCEDTASSSDHPEPEPEPSSEPEPKNAGSSGAFQIELVYGEYMPSKEKALLRRAADQWEEVITGDLPDISFESSPYDRFLWDFLMQVTVTDVVDDVRIFVGSGTFIGHSMAGIGGVIAVRTEGELPILSFLEISPFLFGYDDDDIYRVMLHEIGHCLGFGIIWEDLELLQHNYFSGVMARRWFDVLGGSSYRGEKVPTEPGGVHWNTSVFGDELMTTRPVSPYRAPLSAITIASMNDIGYEVNLDAAEEYKVASPSAAKPVTDETWPGCQVLHQAIDVVAEDGRVLDTFDP